MFGRTFCSVPSAAPLSFIKKAVNKVNAVRSAFGFGVSNPKQEYGTQQFIPNTSPIIAKFFVQL